MLPILLVDDSADDLILAERVLRACKLSNPVHRFNNGDACIDYFRNFAQTNGIPREPCLLFLDLTMAPVTGLDVLRAIQGTPLARRSILIMLSGVSDLKRLREGYELGARTFLLKPLTLESVMEFLASIKERVRIEATPAGSSLIWVNSPTSMLRKENLAA